MKLKQWEMLLLVLLWSVPSGVWATAGIAAEPPAAPLADTLLDRAAEPIFSVEFPLARGAALGAPVQVQAPVGEAGDGERHGQALKAVPGMIISDSSHDASDHALASVGNLGTAGVLPAIQSRTLSPAELTTEGSAVVGCPQQRGMKLDRDCREAEAEGSLPTYPHR